MSWNVVMSFFKISYFHKLTLNEMNLQEGIWNTYIPNMRT